MEATEVVKNLWVGSAPAPHKPLEDFDVLVLAAVEHQPSNLAFRGHLIRCGIEDDWQRPINHKEQRLVVAAARKVADHLYDGHVVLCTCRMGWNRSALVAACALKRSSSLTIEEIVMLMREARGEDALSNPSFVEFLRIAPVG